MTLKGKMKESKLVIMRYKAKKLPFQVIVMAWKSYFIHQLFLFVILISCWSNKWLQSYLSKLNYLKLSLFMCEIIVHKVI